MYQVDAPLMVSMTRLPRWRIFSAWVRLRWPEVVTSRMQAASAARAPSRRQRTLLRGFGLLSDEAVIVAGPGSGDVCCAMWAHASARVSGQPALRSEERRVGQEGRAGGRRDRL